MYGVSGICDSELRSSRPFAGCAILLRNSLKCYFSPFHITNRCRGGVLKLYNVSILLLYSCMPCDTTYDYDKYDIFRIYLMTLVAFVAS